MANANSKIYFACGANKKAFGQIDRSLKAQSRAKLGRSEFVAKWSCAFREQTDSRPRRPRRRPRRPRTRRRKGMVYII